MFDTENGGDTRENATHGSTQEELSLNSSEQVQIDWDPAHCELVKVGRGQAASYVLKPKKVYQNFERLLAYADIEPKLNEMRKDVECFDQSGSRSALLDDELITRIYSKCADHDFSLSMNVVHRYCRLLAYDNQYHPVRQHIESVRWDGRDRIKDLLTTFTLAPGADAELSELLLRRWLTSCVAALYSETYPRFQTHGVLVLAGGQGIGKTRWCGSLIPPEGADVDQAWFHEGMAINPDNDDHLRIFNSHWIVELGELQATTRRADMEALKAFITRGADEFRTPYALKPKTYRRQTVMCATVNGTSFLEDSENRRFWVIPVDACDHQHDIDMSQLWAQVLYGLETGASWHLTADEIEWLGRSNSSFKVTDEVIERFEAAFATPEESEGGEYLNLSEILDCAGFETPRKKKDLTLLKNHLDVKRYRYKANAKKWLVRYVGSSTR